MILNITTTSGCRGACVYCPQVPFQMAMGGERPPLLTRTEFSALMPRLADTRFIAFAFGGFSEPFDNPEILELFASARQQSFVDSLWVHTNGESLQPALLDRMARIEFDYFDVSCHGSGPGAHRRARPFVDEDQVMANVYYLLEHRRNIRDLTISVSGPFMRLPQFQNLQAACRKHGANLDVRSLHSRAGLLKLGRRAPVEPGPFRCGKHDFEKPVLIPGGDLSLCCQDFALRNIIGNLHANTFAEIMGRSTLRRHVLNVAAGTSRDSSLACYQCEFCLKVDTPVDSKRVSISLTR